MGAPCPEATPEPAPANCNCECHGTKYIPDDRNDPVNDCWIPGYGYDKPCCSAPTPAPTPEVTPAPAPASCSCECHGTKYFPADRNDPVNDCWIPGYGYDKPCCSAPIPAPTPEFTPA